MVGIIASSLIAFWFFKTAERLNLPIFQWVVGGIVVYYGGFAACMYLLLRPLLDASAGSRSPWVALAMDLTAAAAGVLLAALFRAKVMEKTPTTPSGTSGK